MQEQSRIEGSMGQPPFLVVLPLPLGPPHAESLILRQWLEAVVHVGERRQLRPWRHSLQKKCILVLYIQNKTKKIHTI